ncbi:MAG: phosphoglycerate kinase [Phycisphaeraceae bacterium]|nr:phosphoglycerate kinase [Phycisphaeraceae bacterium]
MTKRSIDQIDVLGRRVLMRVDFNVPMLEGKVADDRRLVAALPTIHSVIDRGGRLILISHLGRPAHDRPDPDLSLQPIAARLSHLLGLDVGFVPDCIGPVALSMARQLQNGQVLLLENLRFHEGEKMGDPGFAHHLAQLGEVYCNNAFATAHRPHASMLALPRAMAQAPRVAGFLLCNELRYLSKVFQTPARPLLAIVGGTANAEKFNLLAQLLDRLDIVLIAGEMAQPILAAERKSIGKSMLSRELIAAADDLLHAASRRRARMMIPVDHLCAGEISPAAQTTVSKEFIAPGYLGLDIGPRTINLYSELIEHAQTIFWYGPMGVAETPPFDVGTKEIALAVTRATLMRHATSVVAGVSTAGALHRYHLGDNVSHISTGGKATLEYLQGQGFASVDSLDDDDTGMYTASSGELIGAGA